MSNQHQNKGLTNKGLNRFIQVLTTMREHKMTWDEVEEMTALQFDTPSNLYGQQTIAAENQESQLQGTNDLDIEDEWVAYALDEKENELPSYPTPNLSFLQKGITSSSAIEDATLVESSSADEGTRPSEIGQADKQVDPTALEPFFYLDSPGKLIIELSEWILQEWNSLSDSFRREEPELGVAALYRSKNQDHDGDELLYAFSLPNIESTGSNDYTQLDIRIYKDKQYLMSCSIYVEVILHNRESFELDGTEVKMKRGGEILDTQWSDMSGTVCFKDVKLEDINQLVFEVLCPEL